MMIPELEITKSEVELNCLIKSAVIQELLGENQSKIQIEEVLINTDFFKGNFSETNNCIHNFLAKLEFDLSLG